MIIKPKKSLFNPIIIDFLQNKNIRAIKIKNPTPTIEIGLIYRKDKYMCAATREFIEQLKRTVHSLQN